MHKASIHISGMVDTDEGANGGGEIQSSVMQGHSLDIIFSATHP